MVPVRRGHVVAVRRAAVPALLVLGVTGALAGCGDSGSDGAAEVTTSTSSAGGSSASSAASTAGQLPVTMAGREQDGADLSCDDATSTPGYLATWDERSDGANGGSAAIVLYYCGDGTVPVEADPQVTVLDDAEASLPVTVDAESHDAATPGDMTEDTPMCLLLTWEAPAAGTVEQDGASVTVGGTSTRAPFSVPATTSFGTPAQLTSSGWVASSGGPGSCLGN